MSGALYREKTTYGLRLARRNNKLRDVLHRRGHLLDVFAAKRQYARMITTRCDRK